MGDDSEEGRASLERRLRITLPGRESESLDAVRNYLEFAGALHVAITREGERAVLTARLAPASPPYLEDRVENWLHSLDPEGQATLDTARGAGAWRADWGGIYEGAIVPPFHILPPGGTPEPGLHAIFMDPRGAFGSGLHPTTEVTLRAMARALAGARPGAPLLDVGAGSGVLSIAAARMGLEPTAVDIEPGARLACGRTAARNGVRIRVSEGDLASVGERFPYVVANLNPHAVRDLAPALRDALEPGGVLIVSGFAKAEAPAVEACYGLGSGEVLVSSDGEWAALTLRRPLPAPPLPAASSSSGAGPSSPAESA